MEFSNLHNLVLEKLYLLHFNNNEIKFIPRRTNRGAKLDDGFWFYGDTIGDAVVIPFWGGWNWKIKNFNIALIISHNFPTLLRINTIDSEEKTKALSSFTGGLEQFEKKYQTTTPFEGLEQFMKEDWPVLNEIIKNLEGQKHIFDSDSLSIISEKDFSYFIQNLQQYKKIELPSKTIDKDLTLIHKVFQEFKLNPFYRITNDLGLHFIEGDHYYGFSIIGVEKDYNSSSMYHNNEYPEYTIGIFEDCSYIKVYYDNNGGEIIINETTIEKSLQKIIKLISQ